MAQLELQISGTQPLPTSLLWCYANMNKREAVYPEDDALAPLSKHLPGSERSVELVEQGHG